MGRREYSSPLQGSIDQLQETIDEVEAAVQGIDEVVTELKNTDIAQLATTVANLKVQNNSVGYTDFDIGSPAQNTWYTALNVASASGVLTRLSGYTGGVIAKLEIRITIDGVAQPIIVNSNNNLSRAMRYETNKIIDAILFVKFKTSLLIEVRTTEATTPRLTVAMDWGRF